mmetsp:Transcript_3951/g.7296  ORF Transcript_3951/g.7296 Transcript_3951/m.7296 type:complete len:110 (-) Transcript_3951:1542-1871(-)
MVSKRKRRGDQFMYILIEAKPVISDPRELSTIIRSSLKSLFGETESHGCFVEVPEADRSHCIIKCLASSVEATRAALTFPSPPPYLQEMHYRFDVLAIHPEWEGLRTTK